MVKKLFLESRSKDKSVLGLMKVETITNFKNIKGIFWISTILSLLSNDSYNSMGTGCVQKPMCGSVVRIGTWF